MSQDNVEVVKTMYREFTAGNIDAALATISPDVVWDEGDGHPYGPPVKGLEEVKEKVFARLGEEWPGLATVPEHFVHSDEFVVVLGQDDGVFKPTGKKLSTAVAHVFRVQDGKIVSFTQYCDTHAWYEAMAK
jgi:ketosteroid isomerase-like protein